jgi:streptogramin lyase
VLGAAEQAEAVRITEFPLIVPNSSPLGITAGPDGNMWFTEVSGSRIGRITPAGVITDWSTGSGISTNSRPWGITAGADGNLWFSEEVGRIGRITTLAVATEFSAGLSPGSGPRGIIAGPDGNVWFTEDFGGIGRISPTGAVVEFSQGIPPGSRPLSIATGSDGNFWFTSVNADTIRRITPAGVVTDFSTGIAQGARPHDITAGPDGNLWFTENGLARIGRITPSGVVTEFSAGITPGSQPRAITAGPDGNLWFTEEVGNRLGRITPEGVVTEFPVGSGGNFGVTGIAAGPTGDLWYTGSSTNVIGRVSLDPSVSTGAASAIASTTAALAGTVTPFSTQTSYAFEYGRTTAYGSSTAPQILAPSLSPRRASANVAGLEAGTLYHYRLVATSPAGTSRGSDRTFTTSSAGPGGGSGTATPTDQAAPRMAITGRSLTLRKAGVQISLRCPLAEPLGCRGKLRLETVARPGRRAVSLGSASFRVGGGQTRSLVVRLSRRGLTLVRQARRLPARVVVNASDAAGNRARTVVRVTVRSPKR